VANDTPAVWVTLIATDCYSNTLPSSHEFSSTRPHCILRWLSQHSHKAPINGMADVLFAGKASLIFKNDNNKEKHLGSHDV